MTSPYAYWRRYVTRCSASAARQSRGSPSTQRLYAREPLSWHHQDRPVTRAYRYEVPAGAGSIPKAYGSR